MSEVVHPKSLDFGNQRRVVLLRDSTGASFSSIATEVKNLQGRHPSGRLVARLYKQFSRKQGRRRYHYSNCGRKPWKLTKEVEAFLLRRLRALRKACVCTSSTLQREAWGGMGTGGAGSGKARKKGGWAGYGREWRW